MTMQEHILAALGEQIERWEELQASLDEAQLAAPLLPSGWTIKDVVVHLWAWQQRSIARLEAATARREPVFPAWAGGIDPELEENTSQINDWIYQTNRQRSWAEVCQDWREGYRRLIELGAGFSEQELLDSSGYAWLEGFNEGYHLADVLIATYDHHQEHFDMLSTWLRENM